MSVASAVAIDSFRGEARVGRTVIPIAVAGARGELRVGGAGGPILRPLTFGERDRAVARAAMSSNPREELAAAIMTAATVRDGVGEPLVSEIIALVLAGAGVEDAPGFSECALRIAQTAGWDYRQLADAQAAEIDRLAVSLHRSKSESRWSRLVLAAEPAGELEAVRAELLDNLLRRAEIAPSELEPIDTPVQKSSGIEAVANGLHEAGRKSRAEQPAAKIPWRLIEVGATADADAPPPRMKVAAARSDDSFQPPSEPRVSARPTVSFRKSTSANRVSSSHTETPSTPPSPAIGDLGALSFSASAAVLPSPPDCRQSEASAYFARPSVPAVWPSISEPDFGSDSAWQMPARLAGEVTAVENAAHPPQWEEMADELAALLHEQADLRGLDR